MEENVLIDGEIPTMRNADKWFPKIAEDLRDPETMKHALDKMKGMFTAISDDLFVAVLSTDPTMQRFRMLQLAVELLRKSSMPGAIMECGEDDMDGEILMSEFVWFVSSCKGGNRYGEDEMPRIIYEKYRKRLNSKNMDFDDTLDDYLKLFDGYCVENYGVTDD